MSIIHVAQQAILNYTSKQIAKTNDNFYDGSNGLILTWNLKVKLIQSLNSFHG